MRYEDLKNDLTLCGGARKGSGAPCRGTLYRCEQCGHIGCKQSRDEMCSNQGFNGVGRCLKCEAANRMETIAPGDYTTQQAWLSGSQPSAE